jgi:hypothetical protein
LPTPLGINLSVDGRTTIEGLTVPRNAASWDPDVYEAAVVRTHARVHTNPVGRAVLHALQRPVVIIPFRDMNGANAFASTSDRQAETPLGEHPFYCSDDPATPDVDETGRPIPGQPPGTGAGTGGTVEFTPQMWPRGPGLAPADEVLLHELVHAAQSTQGVMSCAPAGYGYDTFTEFCAITVTNMYCSYFFGRGALLRRNHRGFRHRLYADDIMNFYGPDPLDDHEWEMIDRFRVVMPALTHTLESLPPEQCLHNPFTRQRAGRRLYDLDSL